MTLLLGFAAVNTGNNLLYLLVSALLGFLAVSGLLGRGNLAGLQVEVDLPEEIYDGRPTLATVRLENRKRWPAFLVRVEVAGSPALFITVGGRQTATGLVSLSFAGRGERLLPPLQLHSAFPVGFFLRRFTLASAQKLTVFPAPRNCSTPTAGPGAPQGKLSGDAPGYEGEVTRISDYRGEPLKLIHWKLSARQAELKVRQLSAPRGEPVLVEPARLPGPGLEEQLSCACFLINRLQREGRPVGLRLGGRTTAPALSRSHRLRLLTELAHHDPG